MQTKLSLDHARLYSSSRSATSSNYRYLTASVLDVRLTEVVLDSLLRRGRDGQSIDGGEGEIERSDGRVYLTIVVSCAEDVDVESSKERVALQLFAARIPEDIAEDGDSDPGNVVWLDCVRRELLREGAEEACDAI
jgi:hypothetical protein